MCVIFIITSQHPDYPIIIAANRDEYYARPTASAHFWPDKPILAGKDLLAGGTWLGVNRQGRFAAVTNFRQPVHIEPARSRGLLVTDFLACNYTLADYSAILSKTSHEYSGYNCVFGTLLPANSHIQYFSNRTDCTTSLNNGIYALSNALLDTPWHKVTLGKTMIERLLLKPFEIEEWMQALHDTQYADDSSLPNTGIRIETERFLSPMFIQGNDYGTRCSTVITVSKTGLLNFFERTYRQNGICTTTEQFSFEITPQ